MNKVHLKNNPDKEEPDLPAELYRLAVVLAVDEKLAKTGYSGAPYYQARYYLDYLMYALGIKYEVKSFDKEPDTDEDKQMFKPFELVRSGLIEVDGEIMGIVGEPKVNVRNNFKLPKYSSMIELDLLKLMTHAKSVKYSKLSNYPFSEQDVSFKLPANISYQEIYDQLSSELDKLTENSHVMLTPLDIFQKEDDSSNKHVTFRLHISSYDKTLKTSEVSDLVNSLGVVAKEKFGAEII
jgi:phenylalanyl-tRNA synthetase beta subunit